MPIPRLCRFLAAAVLGSLVLTAGASAATPRFALFDLRSDLAAASHNEFGDLKVWKDKAGLVSRAGGSTLVWCGTGCSLGAGWLAFARPAALVPADVASAATQHSKKLGWAVALTLTPRGHAHWRAFSRRAAASAARNGLPDALVLVLNGTIVAQPVANRLVAGTRTLVIPGLSRANALRTAQQLK
jgi:hypothetical protein